MSRPATGRSRAGASCDDDGVNVQVVLRCRPLSQQEVETRAQKVVECKESTRQVEVAQSIANKKFSKTFTFDKVFGSSVGQEDVFSEAIAPIVSEVMEGFNCTVFAYGQTGTGKTYTMEGGDRESVDGAQLSSRAGVIPRAIKQIFDSLQGKTDHTVKVSFLELYNEEITDLLAVGDDMAKKLSIRDDGSGSVHVHNLEEIIVKDAPEIYSVLDRGAKRRTSAETLLNKLSSRSHSVFTITIHMRDVTPEGEEIVKVGKLNLVDLAGSENISRSGAKDQRAREAGEINKSLLCLGRVISALVEKQAYVPYRDSKLTRLLRESLGGKAKTCIIATIAPTVLCLEETINTLDYAHRAKNIRNKPEINQKISKGAMLKEYALEIDKLHAQLWAAREKEGVYLPMQQYREMERELAEKSALVVDLEKDMQGARDEMLALHREVESKEVALQEAHRAHQEVVAALQQSNCDLAGARQLVAEQGYVIEHQRGVEARLCEHMASLTNELARAGQEITQLFAKVDRILEIESSNRQTVSRVRASVMSGLAQIAEALAQAAQTQSASLHAMVDSASESLNRTARFEASLSAKLDVMGLARDTTLREAETAIASLAKRGEEALQSVHELGTGYASATISSLHAMAQEAAGRTRGMRDQLQEEQGHLEELIAASRSTAVSVLETAEAMTRMAQDSLAGARTASLDVVEAARAELQEQSQAGQEIKSTFQEESGRLKRELMTQVEQLLEGFLAKGGSLITTSVDSVVSGATRITSLLDDKHRAIETSNGRASSKLSEMQSHMAALVEGGAERSEGTLTRVDATMGKVSDALKHTAAAVTERVSQLQQAADEHTATLLKLHRNAGDAVHAIGNDHVAKIQAEAARLKAAVDAAQQEVRDDVAAARTFAETVAHQARECASLGVESASHRAEALRALGVDVDMHLGDGYASDQPTGQTPKKRRVDVSPCVDDMRSKGEDELRAEFRRLQSVGQAPAVETPAMPVAAFHGQATSLDKENENAIAPSVGKHCHDSSGMHKEKVLCESNAA